MTRTRRIPSRWVRWTLASVAALVVCGAFGLTTANAELSLGPHEARYEVTTDDLVTVDFGPLGTLQIDSPVPFGLGADVTVKEIPAELREVDESATLDALQGDAQSYLQFFSTPESTIERAVRALVKDALVRTLVALVVVAGAVAGVALLMGSARRREVSAVLAPRTWEVTAGVVVLGLVTGTLTSGVVRHDPDGEPSAVFAGTALEGARITGRLAGVIDTYGGKLLDTYRDNEDFYADADASLDEAWSERLAQQESFDLRASVGLEGPAALQDALYRGEIVTMVVISDLHCNMSMAPLITTTVERSGASVVLNAGDTTMNGTSVEDACVTAFAGAAPDGVTTVVADGNHDSVTTSEQERKAGDTVLDGEVVEVEGVRILGDRDALETRVAQGSKVADTETPDEQAARLATTACDARDGVDLLLVHNPRVGDAALESGCVPFQVSGHYHRRVDPVQVGDGIQYVSSSTAGATLNEPTVGPLHGTAEMTVLRFDTEAREIVDYQVVSVDPGGTATVGERIAVPAVVPTTPPYALTPTDGPTAQASGSTVSPSGTTSRSGRTSPAPSATPVD
ncbi:calcineurin-like phosphoesterase family protein [Sediminihabitans luteus]|uniref:Calcineurin-like phosphoesterase family protein n=1 Tax=Sediminihabitans luteus TaxID=1138585 RepID=A0A2M9CPT2_9CELL|nr:metallophosphoesterase family protein [Sediminihabitans luteus]PJJ73907.1 calcineurin-like phosphoesterase family protein [Sediminihabitans luteus]